ncbi:pullulanase-type alpha-1,6-glucosidase [Allohahella marinimesophila]|uniref:Glycosyl hydrolase family 13 catalytic domain-containing protein n=1 Tax=Allohahella marinimesophila TaxID=1054972 RepID=A0ABP7NGC5_9GAMM
MGTLLHILQWQAAKLKAAALIVLALSVLTACKERPIQDEIFYFVLPDRFSNGDPTNDTGGLAADKEISGLDPADANYYHGGDLRGLYNKLDYLKNMGVTSIWMTPIFKNRPTQPGSAGYHGYWTLDYTSVDPHLGTNEEMAAFIKHAHRKGMKVFFDIVINHTADVIAYEECHKPDGSLLEGMSTCPYTDTNNPSYTPFIPAGLEDAKTPDWLNDPSVYNNRGDSTFAGESSILGDFYGLDDLNTADQRVVSGMGEIFKFWIREFGIDGFRLDTVKHVDLSFWQQWAPEMKAYAAELGNDDFFMFGEVFDGSPRVVSRYTTVGKLQSALDFGTYFASKDVFAGTAGTQRLADLFQEDDWYADADSDANSLLTFTGNHDVGRIGGDIQRAFPDESDAEHLARLQMAYALNYFGRGVPVVYYGDEQGFTGAGGDGEARQDMFPSEVAGYNDDDLIGTDRTTADDNFSTRHPMYRTLRAYAKVLKQHKALRYGQMTVRSASGEPGIFAFSRVWQQDPNEYLVVMNTSTEVKALTIAGTSGRYDRIFGEDMSRRINADAAGEIVIEMPALSVAIYRAKTEINAAAPEMLTLALDESRKVSGRFEIPVIVEWTDVPVVPMTAVELQVQIDAGEFVTVATDSAPDRVGVDGETALRYRAIYSADDLEGGTMLTFRAVAESARGEKLISETSTVEVGTEPGLTVRFQKPEAWGDEINIYYWNADPSPAVEWPGVPVTALGGGVYEFQFAEGTTAANLIFNDGAGNQTADLFRDADGCFAGDAWVTSCEDGGGDGDGSFAVYFQKPASWATPRVYYWNPTGSADPVTWPGVEMTLIGEDWYKFVFPAGVTASNIIFNDGDGAQTSDLFREGSGCFDFATTAWTDTCDYPAPGLRVRFKRPESWGADVNIYWFNANGETPAIEWPGVPATSLGNDWYEFQFPSSVTASNLIFNDGQGNQTTDLFRDSDGCFGETGEEWTDTCDIPEFRPVEIIGARAHWLEPGRLVWRTTSADISSVRLLSSDTAAISVVEQDGIETIGGESQVVTVTSGGALMASTLEKFPHLAEAPVFSLDLSDEQAKGLMNTQLVAVAYDEAGGFVEATRVQLPGVIDTFYTTEAQLGPVFDGGLPSIRVWAPTAQALKLKFYDAGKNLIQTLQADQVENGVYTFDGSSDWTDRFYRFEVTVYQPASGAIETYEVTDPYSLSLSTDSAYSQLVDIANDESLKPVGWDALVKELPAFRDITLYEGHVRDFSATDESVPEALRGKYLAFTYNGRNGKPKSAGMQHLENLEAAGLTHFHVLPVNDIASVKENPADRVDLNDPYSRLCTKVSVESVQAGCAEFGDTPIGEVFAELVATDPVTQRLQAINYDSRLEGFPGVDGFNWGYDPYHFLAPEGSYATNPDGKTRIRELREMAMALDEIGLKLVVDVVYNHTYGSGLSDQSVLDKLVPGYYHRLNPTSGAVETSTCCDNTAAEHAMMSHLMKQAVTTWAKYYKIDAFRFDLMGHHPKTVMQEIQATLAELTPASDGVQGDRIYIYGEGWDFGEVTGGQRFEQATQFNMAGTGVGTFNDRLRDGVRGGNFTDRGRAQGFANGNETYPNGVTPGAGALSDQADRIRIGLAGNLADYPFVSNSGAVTTGLDYSGVGYTADPQENVIYVDKHDNETLWDNTQAKLPDDLQMDARVRVHLLSQAFVNLGQGVPFHQMGTDLLRSKSMDRDSFDAGDWFNKVDFTAQSNNWAVGLPSEDKNVERWPLMREIMSNPNIDPQPEHIQRAAVLFQEQLALRYSSPLFRLDDADDVINRLGFLNTGAAQTPGLIAMTISDGECAGSDVDATYEGVVVMFNADDDAVSFRAASLAGLPLILHPLQVSGSDDVVRMASFDAASGDFNIPGRTYAVFVLPEGAENAGAMPCNTSIDLILEPGFTVYFNSPAAWEDVSLYYFETSPTAATVDWPGVAMESLGNDWYSYTLPSGVEAANIIFNNAGAGEQTPDLYREGNGCYDFTAASWSDSCELPGLQFHFKKPAEWTDQVNFYWFGAASPSPDWPGVPMVNLGDGWFRVQMADGVDESNIIFNDAGPSGTGNQTADLFRKKGGCYSIAEGWAQTCSYP